MKRHTFPAIFLILSILLTGCGLNVFESVPTATSAPTAIPLPTNLPPTDAPAPLGPGPTQSVPLCTVDPLISSCAVPKVEERDKYCVEKLPYVQFAMAPGVTFESLDPTLKCNDQGLRGGEQVIACTGQPLIAYDLKICNAACSPNALVADARCPENYGFSADAGCCYPMPADDAGCVIVKVNISACR